jgi:two-component system NtrC family sensor kinase
MLHLNNKIPTIYGVPDHLHQVVVNLLLNAVDAMQESENPCVTIKTKHSNEHVLLSISDVGKGIPEEKQNRIFEPFYTTKDVGKGTGLGLSVSHGIVSKMGGDITVDSEVGQGTTFTITIPIEESLA